MYMKNLTILGSTGSIGTNALRIVAQFPERFTVKVLTAGQNIAKLAEQIKQFRPELVAVFDEAGAAPWNGPCRRIRVSRLCMVSPGIKRQQRMKHPTWS